MSQGSATISGAGNTWKVTGEAPIGVGYDITVDPGSLAVLHLGSGRTFELAQGETSVTGPDRIRLAKGAALGDLTSRGQIETDGVGVSSASGTFRVTVSGATTGVGVFSGLVTVSVPGSTLAVPAFREASTASGVLPAASKPLEILAGGDVWDHRYLRDAIDLDARLDNFSGGLDAQLGSATGLGFFRLVTADPVTLAHVGPFLSQPRSDVLIALVLAATSRSDPPEATFDKIMSLWLAGESWGLLAMEYHVAAQDVFAGLVAAIRKLGLTFTTPTPRFAPIPGTTLPPVVALGPAMRASQAPAAAGTPGSAPAPTASPTAVLNQVLDPITTLLSQILGLLLPQPPTSTSTPGG
ncbi:MAG: hypothetical protein E6G66_00880 [Actinobacteria bacterium]|nr:MAG: hypothetical protein E6G66_00880 [Actinomycetota bacterium]